MKKIYVLHLDAWTKLITESSLIFFRPRDAFKYEVSGIDVGEITEVKIKSERKIRTETGWELRKVQ